MTLSTRFLAIPAASLLLVSALSAPVLAQSTTPEKAGAAATGDATAQMKADTLPDRTTGADVNVGVKVGEPATRADTAVGLPAGTEIYSNDGAKLGTVETVLSDEDNTRTLVLALDSKLGIGETGSVAASEANKVGDRVVVGMTAAEFKAKVAEQG